MVRSAPLPLRPSPLQVLLLLAAVAAVPWMLLPKPLILNARFKAVQVSLCGGLVGGGADWDACWWQVVGLCPS